MLRTWIAGAQQVFGAATRLLRRADKAAP